MYFDNSKKFWKKWLFASDTEKVDLIMKTGLIPNYNDPFLRRSMAIYINTFFVNLVETILSLNEKEMEKLRKKWNEAHLIFFHE
jgi:hypothetical protein